MNHTLSPALVAVAVALHAFVAVANDVPVFNVSALCRAEANATPEQSRVCMADEKKAHEDLVRQWAQFAPDSRARCTRMSTSIAGIESYVELLTCLQMAMDAKNLPKQ